MGIHARQSRSLSRREPGRRMLLGDIARWVVPWAGADGVGKAADLAGSGAKRFLEFSRLATGHQRLEPALGTTLFAVLVKHDHLFTSKLALLEQFARRHKISDVETLDAA